MSCPMCVLEFHAFCSSPNTESLTCCCSLSTMSEETKGESPLNLSGPTRPVTTIKEVLSPPVANPEPVPPALQGKWKKRGAPLKAGKDMKSLLATGRARANVVKPLSEGDVCEWRGLRYAGGGVTPLIGCRGNPAESVHHGPNKSVLHNEPTNLHKVCQVCHERWHIINDAYYGSVRPEHGESWLPNPDVPCYEHSALVVVTPETQDYNEFLWKKLRDASRHSRHEEAEQYRNELTDLMLNGISEYVELVPRLDKVT